MTGRRTKLLLLLLRVAVASLLALAVAGCGESSGDREARYERELTAALEAVPTVAARGGGATGDGAARDLDAVVASLEDAHGRLAAVEPPERHAATHRQLVDGVEGMADDARMLADAQRVVASDPARARELTRTAAASRSSARVTDAVAKLREDGIDVTF